MSEQRFKSKKQLYRHGKPKAPKSKDFHSLPPAPDRSLVKRMIQKYKREAA